MNRKTTFKMLKSGELFFKVKEKLSVCNINNEIIKNKQLQYREYCRLNRKYKKTINSIKKRSKDINTIPSNKVWVFWLQGEKNAPELVKRCIDSTRRAFKDREVIVLDKDNYKEYVDFPDYIEEKFAKGIIPFAHFSDLIRIELLAKHGGIWCDATLYITGEIPDYVKNANLFVFKNINLDRTDEEIIVASNWFLSAYANNNIIVATRDLLFEYWKHERFLTNYFNFHILFKIVVDIYKEEWENIPTFTNVNPHILQFELFDEFSEERFEQIKSICFMHKLNRHIENKDLERNNFYNYILKN